MLRFGICAIALSFALSGPAFADATTAPPPNDPDALLRQQAAALDAKPLSKFIWQMSDDGSALHLQSGLVCPAKWGAFTRGRPATFDTLGTDIGCDYQNGLGTEVTMYLTQRHGQWPGDDLAKAQAELQQFHPGYTLLPPSAEGALECDAPWKRVLYGGNKDTLHSGIWLRDLGGWTLEFRASYAAISAGDAVAAMNALAAQALSSAGTHLAACAAAAPVERTGTAVTDDATLMMMVILAAAATGAADIDKSKDADAKPVAHLPENWCVEPAGNSAALFWRNIASDNHNGAVDRLTVDGETNQQVIVVEGAPLLALVANTGARADAPLTHMVTLTQGTLIYILGIYDGRPSAADVFALARDILTEKRKPLAARDMKTGKVNIYMPQ